MILSMICGTVCDLYVRKACEVHIIQGIMA